MNASDIQREIIELRKKAESGYYPRHIARVVDEIDLSINNFDTTPEAKIAAKSELNNILTLAHTVTAKKIAKSVLEDFEFHRTCQNGLDSLLESMKFAGLDASKLGLDGMNPYKIALLIEACRISP